MNSIESYSPSPIFKCPQEILTHILLECDLRSIFNTRLVSKKMADLPLNGFFWKSYTVLALKKEVGDESTNLFFALIDKARYANTSNAPEASYSIVQALLQNNLAEELPSFPRILHNGLMVSHRRSLKKIKEGRAALLNLLKERPPSQQTKVFIHANDGKKVNLDCINLQLVLRYMIMVGDIAQYERDGMGFQLCENNLGKSSSQSILPVTKALLLKVDQNLQKFKPVMPSGYSQAQSTLWDCAVQEIKQEIYQRHFRVDSQDLVVNVNASKGKAYVFKKVFDDLVDTGVIAEWNATRPGLVAQLKIHKDSIIKSNTQYVWPVWRDKTNRP